MNADNLPTLRSPPSPSTIWHCPDCTYANGGGSVCDMCKTPRPKRTAQASKLSPPPPVAVLGSAGERASAQDPPPSGSADVRSRAVGKLARASLKRTQERARLLSEVNQRRPPRLASEDALEKRAAERARLLAGVQQRGGAHGSVATAVSTTPPTLSRADRYRIRSAEKDRVSAEDAAKAARILASVGDAPSAIGKQLSFDLSSPASTAAAATSSSGCVVSTTTVVAPFVCAAIKFCRCPGESGVDALTCVNCDLKAHEMCTEVLSFSQVSAGNKGQFCGLFC